MYCNRTSCLSQSSEVFNSTHYTYIYASFAYIYDTCINFAVHHVKVKAYVHNATYFISVDLQYYLLPYGKEIMSMDMSKENESHRSVVSICI